MMKYQQNLFHTLRSLFTVIVCLLTFFIISGMSNNLFSAGISTIKVFKKAEIKGDKVRLGRIATIRGEDSQMINKLSAIVISKAPLPGKSRRIDEDYIKIRLKQNGIDLSQIRLLVPGKVEVCRDFIEIPREKIEKVMQDANAGVKQLSQQQRNKLAGIERMALEALETAVAARKNAEKVLNIKTTEKLKLEEEVKKAEESFEVARFAERDAKAEYGIHIIRAKELKRTKRGLSKEKKLEVETFFANPYHSWERGTNQNTNGLLRRYFPKGTLKFFLFKTLYIY